MRFVKKNIFHFLVTAELEYLMASFARYSIHVLVTLLFVVSRTKDTQILTIASSTGIMCS